MSFTVKDGTGSGNVTKVDGNNRLHVESVSQPINEQATEKGDSYNINTGMVTLTDGAETPMLFFKNNEDRDFHIQTVIVYFGTSTGGVGNDGQFTIIKNPATGTIITSTPTDVAINSNRNFGSSKTLADSLAYVGATGDTMTDGSEHILVGINDGGSRVGISIDELLEKGNSVGVKVTPPSSNTSMTCYVAVVGYLVDDNNRD